MKGVKRQGGDASHPTPFPPFPSLLPLRSRPAIQTERRPVVWAIARPQILSARSPCRALVAAQPISNTGQPIGQRQPLIINAERGKSLVSLTCADSSRLSRKDGCRAHRPIPSQPRAPDEHRPAEETVWRCDLHVLRERGDAKVAGCAFRSMVHGRIKRRF